MTISRFRINKGFFAGAAYTLIAYGLAGCPFPLLLLLSRADARPVTDLFRVLDISLEPAFIALLGTALLSAHITFQRKRKAKQRTTRRALRKPYAVQPHPRIGGDQMVYPKLAGSLNPRIDVIQLLRSATAKGQNTQSAISNGLTVRIRRAAGSVAVSTLLLSVLPLTAEGSAMLPEFTVSVSGGVYNGPNVTNNAAVRLKGGLLGVPYTINTGDTTAVIAAKLRAALNDPGLSNIPEFFTFSAPAPSPVLANTMVISSALTPGNTERAFGGKVLVGKKVTGVRVSVAVDPLPGFADFEISGTANGDGTVTVGIDGVSESVSTTAGESDADIMQALMTLLETNDHLTHDAVDISTPTDDEFTEFGIDTGDPTTSADIGAFLESEDSGLSTAADINVAVPEPSSLLVLCSFLTSCSVCAIRRRSSIKRDHRKNTQEGRQPNVASA
jgi:hypothetical protein